MQRHSLLIPLFLLLATSNLTACQRSKPEHKASNPVADATTATAATNDNAAIVAQTPASLPPASVGLKKTDFPAYLVGVPSLLHPIVPSALGSEKDTIKDSSSKAANDNVNYFQQTSPYQFSCSIYNLVFENIKTGESHRLFNQDNYVIKSVFYPFIDTGEPANEKLAIAQSDATTKKDFDTKKIMLGHFIYQVKESADDNDSKTNIDDQLSLYMSDDMGKNLKKLHPNNQYVTATHWMPEIKRFYFVTQADSNNDKVIDSNDKYYNYVIDFTKTDTISSSQTASTPTNASSTAQTNNIPSVTSYNYTDK